MAQKCNANIEKQIYNKLQVLLPKDLKAVLSIVQLFLPEHTIEQTLQEFTPNQRPKILLEQILASIGYNPKENKKIETTEERQVSNINVVFTSPSTSDLFETLHIAESYFERQAKELITYASKIGSGSTYTNSNKQLNNDFKDLKNSLFEKIVNYLKNKGVNLDYSKYYKGDNFNPKSALYVNGVFQNYDLYKEAMVALEQHLLGPNNENAIKSSKQTFIPNIKGDIRKALDRQTFDAYNAAILLANFDNVLAKYFGNSISFDYSLYNEFTDPVREGTKKSTAGGKYFVKETGKTVQYWLQDSHQEEGVETIKDELSENIINIIKHVNKAGEETGMYLSTNDFYSLGSYIREFERNNLQKLLDNRKNKVPGYENWTTLEREPGRMLFWYLNNIQKAFDNSFTGDTHKLFGKYFMHRVDIVKSINSFLEGVKEKEESSDFYLTRILAQKLNNTFGANYSIYNAGQNRMISQEMHSHNANKVDINNSIYSHLLHNSKLTNKFWIGIDPITTTDDVASTKELTKELENITKRAESNIELSSLIYKTLGVYIGSHGAEQLKAKWGESLPYKIQEYLKEIRSIQKTEEDSQDSKGKSIIDRIIENETSISEEKFELAYTPSEVIASLVKKIQDIQDIYLDNFILRPIMNISTLTGEQIPTYKIPNLMYNDTETLINRYDIENDGSTGRHFSSLYLQEDMLLGTSTGLEVINRNKNKAVGKFNTIESFTANFEYAFLDSFKSKSKADGIHVMIGNYSDKNTIMSKIINKNAKKGDKFIIGNQEGTDILSLKEVQNLFKKQSGDYYTDLLNSVFDQYKKLGVKINNKNKSDDANIQENIKIVNDYLGTFKSKDDFLKLVVQKSLQDPSIRITEELHYSNYPQGEDIRLALNQSIVDYYRIFTTDTFNEFIKREEESLAKKLIAEKGEFLFSDARMDAIERSNDRNYEEDRKVLNGWLKSFGINAQDYKSFDTKEGQKIKLSNGRINPLLSRWMWTTNLFKSEYLFLTVKPEYMHPHKVRGLEYRGDSNEVNLDQFDLENTGRIPNMSKRNISFTATYEIPSRNLREGTPEDINVAVIGDANNPLYTISGVIQKQDIHDGSSLLSYAYSKMIEASYPGKSYEGTKKRIGTFVGEFSSSLKKDAETVLTNYRIRNSVNSDINLKLKQKQSLSAFPLPNFKRDVNSLPASGIYYKDGNYFKVSSYSIDNGYITIALSKYNKETGKFDFQGKQKPQEFKNLYDLWVLFGGEYSVDKVGDKFKFSESSNDLIYDLVTNVEIDGKYELKNKMIHIISNHSSFKSGATNLNPSSYWNDNTINKLGFTTLKSSFIGPQLAANHETDASQIKEITQIISALSQNPKTASIANEVYEDIARIIEESARPYLTKIIDLTDKTLKDYYKVLSRNFANSLASSNEVSLAKTISDSFGRGAVLPFSHQSLFRGFTRDLITKMNNEFIVRYYQGIGAVLNPSHRIIQIYETKNGDVLTQEELAEKAFEWHDSLEASVKESLKNLDGSLLPTTTTEDIINAYKVIHLLNDEKITVSQINPGDTVIDSLGQRHNLSDIKTYYNFKKNNDRNAIVTKVYNVARDLKPSEINFKIGTENYNIFDTDSLRLIFDLQLGNANPDLDSFAKFFNIDRENKKALLSKLNFWTQRNLELLDERYLMKSIEAFRDKKGIVDWGKFFGTDSLVNRRFDEVSAHYMNNNSEQVTDYTFKPAEIILGNMYKGSFDTGEDSINLIRGTVSEGKNVYFNNKLEAVYKTDSFKADLKVIPRNGDRAVYIKYVKDFPQSQKEDLSIFASVYDEDKAGLVTYRVGVNGQPLYMKPKNSKIIKEEGYDIIYMKVGSTISREVVDENGKISKVQEILLDTDFKQSLKDLIKSFKGEIRGIIPLMNGDSEIKVKLVSVKEDNIKGEKSKRLKNFVPENPHLFSFNTFKRFNGYNSVDFNFDQDWFERNRDNIISQLGQKTYASWEKSLELIAARIPAQSMQSFMEMKNVAYFNTNSNDAFVSIWQILLQGSDFDIDKAYIMGYGFNKSGQYDTWGNIFDYSTKEQLDALERLPLPNGKVIKINPSGIDITQEIDSFITGIGPLLQFENLLQVSPAIIEQFGTLLVKTRNESISIDPSKVSVSENIEKVIELINKYNSDKDYIRKDNSIKNSIVSKIRKIISMPSSQLLANEPISVQIIKDAGNEAKKSLGFEEDRFSSWDMITQYKQQQDASVGKGDVGIGANGMKIFFALSNYYNAYYDNLLPNNNLPQYKNPKSFLKDFTINNKRRVIKTIANTYVPSDYLNKSLTELGFKELDQTYLKLSEELAALNASAFVSGATDNAKELVMAKINATVELASMHMYLISLGYSMNDVSTYMNSPLGKYVAKYATGNVFESHKDVFIPTIIDAYKKENPTVTDSEISQFKDIYSGAQEFRVLSSILKVNQKVSANIDELNSFLSTFETAVYSREHEVLGMNLVKIREEQLWDNKYDFDSTKGITLIQRIIQKNPILSSFKESEEYVKKTLRKASNIQVSYIDEGGKTQKKTVSIIGGQFDFRYYMHPDNELYREAASEYYNLFKNTINIFDVIQNSPHFREMVNGVSVIHNVLSIYSKKYNFAFNKIRDVLRLHGNRVVNNYNDEAKNLFGNPALPIKVSDRILSKSFRTVENFVVSKWLKSTGNISRFTFNAKDLLKLADASSVTFYTSNSAKYYTTGETKQFKNIDGVKDSIIDITPNSEGDFVIDLTTDFGVANFKILMEEVILKILQKSTTSDLAQSLKLTTVKSPMGLLTTQITSTFNISSLNSPINMEKYQTLLTSFNEVDRKVKNELKVHNSENKVIPYKDLFYLYNLVVNNEMYGDKRLTPLFDDYIKDSNNIGNDYLRFVSKVDFNEVDIFEIPELGQDAEAVTTREKIVSDQIDDILFMLLNNRGQLYINKLNSFLTLKNANFILNTSMEEKTRKESASYMAFNSILSLINNKNLIINFNCD